MNRLALLLFLLVVGWIFFWFVLPILILIFASVFGVSTANV